MYRVFDAILADGGEAVTMGVVFSVQRKAPSCRTRSIEKECFPMVHYHQHYRCVFIYRTPPAV